MSYYLNSKHKERIKDFYEERYSLEELLIMYRDVLHERDKIAYRQLKNLTNGIKRVERI